MNFDLWLCRMECVSKFAALFGTIAQLVEQRTENPCVPGSNPGGTTNINT